jgi:hypothetical protein
MKQPRIIADRLHDLRDLGNRKDDHHFLDETVRLPLQAARLKARQILDERPTDTHMTIVENWRQLPDGQIEFTIRRLRTAD